MNSEKLTQIILGGFMAIAVVSIGWFFIESNKQAAVEEALRKERGTGSVELTTDKSGKVQENGSSKAQESGNPSEVKYSIDKASDPYKTLSLAEAPAKLKQDGEQVFYIGCRDCGHCINLEKVMKQFLDKHKDKNANRDLIYKIEAGFSCVPEPGSEDYKHYEQVYQFLVDAGATEANPDKGFGTPHFYLIKNGKISDSLSKYGRSVEGLEKMFAANHYRGF